MVQPRHGARRAPVPGLLLLVVAACSDSAAAPAATGAAAPDPAVGLRAAAERLAQAMNQGDVDVQVQLAHPKLVDGMGGEAKYRAALMRAKTMADAAPTPPQASILGNPEVARAGERLFGLIDFELRLADESGTPGTMRSYFAAESAADGASWRFLDGAGLRGDVSRLRRVIPDWPSALQLRNVRRR